MYVVRCWWVQSTWHCFIHDRKDILTLSPSASWHGAMINPGSNYPYLKQISMTWWYSTHWSSTIPLFAASMTFFFFFFFFFVCFFFFCFVFFFFCFFFFWLFHLRGLTLQGKATLRQIVVSLFWQGVSPKRKDFSTLGSIFFPFRATPFSNGLGLQKSKHEVIKIVSRVKDGRKSIKWFQSRI